MAFQEFTAREYLQIDIAGNYGLDRRNWNERLSWFQENREEIEDPELFDTTDRGRTKRERLCRKAKEPAMFLAGIKAWHDVLKGRPTGYAISLDATASGIQILSLMVGCAKSAQTCNLIDVGQRMDVYTYHHEQMQAVLEALGQPKGSLTRDAAKYALMTAFYSSTAVPRDTFGAGSIALNVFYKVNELLLPGAWELNTRLLHTWRDDVLSHDWVLPDNFHVHVKCMATVEETVQFRNTPYKLTLKKNKAYKNGRSNPANAVHSVDGLVVRELTARCMFDPKMIQRVLNAIGSTKTSGTRKQDKMVMTLWNHHQKSGFLSVRILQYLDKGNMGLVDAEVILKMLNTFPPKPFQVLSIHDCFRVLPSYGNDLRKQYNQILSDLARSDILRYITTQIVGRETYVNKVNDIADQILEANYALS